MLKIKSNYNLFILCLLFTTFNLYSQNTDSLMKMYRSANHDSIRVRLLLNLAEQMVYQNPDSASRLVKIGFDICQKEQNLKNPNKSISDIFKTHSGYLFVSLSTISVFKGDIDQAFKLTEKGLAYFKKLNNIQGIGLACSNKCQLFQIVGAVDSAIYYGEKALQYFKNIKSNYYITTTLNTLGVIYDYQGNYPKALEFYFEALKTGESSNNTRNISGIRHNIGAVYEALNDFVKAEEYYELALKQRIKAKDQFGLGESYIALGKIMKKKSNYPKAFEYYNKALDIQQKINDLPNLAVTYNNLGQLYRLTDDKKKALEYYHKSMEIQTKIHDKNGLTFSYSNIGGLYKEQKEYDKAIVFSLKSLELAKELGYPENIKNASILLSELYQLKGNSKSAFEYYKTYIKMRDSLNNLEVQKSSIQQQEEFKYEKKKVKEEEKHSAELLLQKEKSLADKKRQNVIIISVSIVLILVAIFSLLLYNRFKTTQKQKSVIEQKEKETHLQKRIIEEKHKEITDSINYAERIQKSFLATTDHLDAYLKEYFILFKPKDTVSGDFYWSSTLINGNFILVTADSTGHGVPGAIMSLLNITSLEKAIETETEPNAILNATRKTIIERLKKDGSIEGGKDGMDCSVCVYDLINMRLIVSTAHNPVWIVRTSTGATPNEVIEIKADKMPVGKHDRDSESFTQKEIGLLKGDVIYTFTDGFSDQFGGPYGKKFMSKNLRELLSKNAHLPMPDQKMILEKMFKDWVGNIEQIDDVTIIGVRV